MCRLNRIGTLVFLGALWVCTQVNADVIRVDHESETNGPGTLWSNAYDNLQDALEAASGGDEIWVADGTYVPSEPTNILYARTATFLLVSDVKMLGGFQGLSRVGGGETDAIQRNPDLYETILSGEVGNPEEDADNLFHVVVASGSDITHDTIINGFTLTLSQSNEDEYGEPTDAGNLYSPALMVIADDAWPVVARCKFLCVNDGAVYIEPVDPAGPIQFLSCTFTGGVGGSYGGSIFCQALYTSEVKLVNCVAYGNVASGSGGFIYSEASTSLINCTITANQSGTAYAGAIRFNGYGDNLVANCIVYGNSNSYGSNEDAQIVNSSSGALVVRNCDIQGLDSYAGNNNIDVDPLFENPGHEAFNLQYLSLLLNNGDESEIENYPDTYDIDDDTDDTEPLPDRAMNYRQVNSGDCIDIGAYEEQTEGSCPGDITGASGVPDGVVNNLDLLHIIAKWDTAGGVADIVPADCGDADVATNDMLVVTNNYGECSSFTSGALTTEEIIAILLEFAAEDESREDAVAEAIVGLLE